MPGNPTVEVQAFGQSLWTDNISRQFIASGELQRFIDQYGVLGLTSNPSLFQKAIGVSADYDEALLAAIEDTSDPNLLYERLAARDIQDAADLMAPIYARTQRIDGYVSLEVSPLLAHDTGETVAEAQRLWEMVARPNLMVKIPATPEGVPAIEEAIARGINVNVTLIFAVANYEQVAEAYIRGLERRLAAGQDVRGIASVASFFLSRIDTMVDRALENNLRAAQGRDLDRVAANRRLLGKAAIANAKLAYRSFQRMFEGERFAALRAAGAQVQRPLWASTGTKNPNYPDTMYVDNLIGPHTVNTLPPDTLVAFADHGTAGLTITEGVDEAEQLLDMLAEVGIALDDVTTQLQADGVEAFRQSFETLLAQVEAKRVVLHSGIAARQHAALGAHRDQVDASLNAMTRDHVNARVWAKDASVWKDQTALMEKIAARLGWLDVRTTVDRERLRALRASVKGAGWQRVLLLGMGGSSLAPEVLARTFGPQEGFPALTVLDSTHPDAVRAATDAHDPDTTLFVVASKSGTTQETDDFARTFWAHSGARADRFIAITDPGSALAQQAEQRGYREVFLNPADIGGRYSALSYFGMVPAALMGLDLDALWQEADAMIDACGPSIPAEHHPGLFLGAFMGALAQHGRDKLTVFASDGVAAFGDWAEQLVAESTGKEGVGVLPVVGSTVGRPHDYSSDRAFVYLKLDGDPSNEALDAQVRALREAGHPRLVLHLPNKAALAGEFFRWAYATAIAGHVLSINPFDEPNVTESKNNTRALLEVFQQEGALPATTPRLTHGGAALYADDDTMRPLRELCEQHGYDSSSVIDTLAAQVVSTQAGDAFVLLAYLPPTPATHEALAEVRRRLRHVSKRAVTVGVGPRYLHSTGQLHKGGPNNGVFLLLTNTPAQDLPIPDEPFSYGTLVAAQAAGDLKALVDKKRRALRLHTDAADVAALFEVLLAAVDAAERRRQ